MELHTYTPLNWQDAPDHKTTPINAENLNHIEEGIQNAYADILQIYNAIYPVGAIYMSVNNVNPGTFFGGTWTPWGSGKVPVGVDTDDTDFDTVEETGGSKTVTLTSTQSGVPAHNHGLNNHTHSIPALSGSAASNGAHVHRLYFGGSVGVSGAYIAGVTEPNTNNGQYASTNGANGYMQTVASAGAHGHTVTTVANTTGGNTGNTADNTAANAAEAHTNLQPYITCYMWKRTA